MPPLLSLSFAFGAFPTHLLLTAFTVEVDADRVLGGGPVLRHVGAQRGLFAQASGAVPVVVGLGAGDGAGARWWCRRRPARR
ncbi:hypothetical protein [Embleya hyalina]|uniref:Uncharacterized protein n=1 Tax=Embleya hyalina TaxID=516124 RepID=A0A401YYJ6_9ACTN|nr:hypothetical protein [Embleya hyalina]GCD99702.1 hypothetical protein EHYA_07424 [Embleya hyalina]